MRQIIISLILGLFLVLSFSFQSDKNQTDVFDSNYYTDSIFSNSLNEYRKHNIYLPKGFDRQKKYPIIYATDGNEIEEGELKIQLDSLIDNHIIKPIIFIESFSNKKIVNSYISENKKDTFYLTYRNYEYMNRDWSNHLLASRFENHMSYFKDELIPSVEKEFNQILQNNDRYFFGVSNGAGFGINLLNRYPELIGTYICFSIYGVKIKTLTWLKGVKYPDLYIEYGDKEHLFLANDADVLKSKYKDLSSFINIKVFEGGHEYKKWNKELILTLSKLFKV